VNGSVLQSPAIDIRSADDVVSELAIRAPGYLAGLNLTDDTPGTAIAQITASYIQTLIQRLNQVPFNDKLAFLDMMGMDLNLPNPSEVPLVFTLAPTASSVRLPAGSQAAAPPPPNASTQVYFETLLSIGLLAGKLQQIVSVVPGSDQWLDHTDAWKNFTPFKIWDTSVATPMDHILYIGDDEVLAFTGNTTLTISLDVTSAGSQPNSVTWEYFNGSNWSSLNIFSDSTQSFTTVGNGLIIKLTVDSPTNPDNPINGSQIKKWIRARFTPSLTPEAALQLPQIQNINISSCIDKYSSLSPNSLLPENVFSDATPQDPSKTIFPFGQQPQAGSTFYFKCDEATGRPNAKVKVAWAVAPTAQSIAAGYPAHLATDMNNTVSWQYWDGLSWTDFLPNTFTTPPFPKLTDINNTIDYTFTVLSNATTTVNQVTGNWIRICLENGGFGYTNTNSATTTSSTTTTTGGVTSTVTTTFTTTSTVSYPVIVPIAFSSFLIGYTCQSTTKHPDAVFAFNDSQFVDCTPQSASTGTPFSPFGASQDTTPALYLGFNNPFPDDQLGIFFDFDETQDEAVGPPIIWEEWNGRWSQLMVQDPDPTRGLSTSGIVNPVTTADATLLSRFGQPLYWLRARLRTDGTPPTPTITRVLPNAVWAVQQRTVVNDSIGTSTGQPSQVLYFRQFPVLPGQRIIVQELAGPQANTEWRALVSKITDLQTVQQLEAQLAQEGAETQLTAGPITLVRNRRKQVTEVWVGWTEVDHFYDSGPNDRHYTLDHLYGRLEFGDARQGKALGLNWLVTALSYQTGGGDSGNVDANTVTQLVSAVGGIQQVTNPIPATGGANGETLAHFAQRAPKSLLHRGRAVLPADYEVMAQEKSAAAAFCLPCIDPSFRSAPGWITLLILPDTTDPRPDPGLGFCNEVAQYILARCPADVHAAVRLNVTRPVYTPVDVLATIVATDPSQTGALELNAAELLQTFLHPLQGGSDSAGWAPGQDVFLSDVAIALKSADGLAYIEQLAISKNGVPELDRVAVGATRIACAGNIQVNVIG
jgi:predicted phage baseplate assembly protein